MQQEENSSVPYQSKKDKFHLIRVPKGFDISLLNGVEFDPHQILEIQVQKGYNGLVNVFEIGSFTEQKMDLNVLVDSDESIKIGPRISQNFLITKSVRLESALSTSVERKQKDPVSLPQGLRERFTPFGSEAPAIDEKTLSKHKKKKKRQSSPDTFSPQRKRVKHCEESDSKQRPCLVNGEKIKTEINESCEQLNGSLDEEVKQHKKRKKIKSEFGSSQEDSSFVEESIVKEKKHKEKKKKKDKDR